MYIHTHTHKHTHTHTHTHTHVCMYTHEHTHEHTHTHTHTHTPAEFAMTLDTSVLGNRALSPGGGEAEVCIIFTIQKRTNAEAKETYSCFFGNREIEREISS